MSAAAAVALKQKRLTANVKTNITNIEFSPKLPNEKFKRQDVNVEVLLNRCVTISLHLASSQPLQTPHACLHQQNNAQS